MLDTDFTALKDFILEHNNYFGKGYANVYKDENTHAVWVKEGRDYKRIMPEDTFGNYFYLRSDTWIKHEAKEPERNERNGMAKTQLTHATCFYKKFLPPQIPTTQTLLPVKQFIQPLALLYTNKENLHEAGICQPGYDCKQKEYNHRHF